MEQMVAQRKGFRFKPGRAVIVRQGQRAHKVVLHPRLVFDRGGRCADGEVAKHLSGVGTQDGGGEAFGQLQTHFGFADGGGADQDVEGFGHRACGERKQAA